MAEKQYPTLKDLFYLPFPVLTATSPMGTKIAYTMEITNWEEDRFERECYVYDTKTEQTNKLSHGLEINNIKWTDENTLFMIKASISSNPEEQKPQIWVYEKLVGDGIQLTEHKNGVNSFEFFGDGIVFLAINPEKREMKDRKQQFGTFVHVEEEDGTLDLYYFSLSYQKHYQKMLSRCFNEKDMSQLVNPFVNLTKSYDIREIITTFVVSPAYNAIYINTQKRSDLFYIDDTSVYRFEINIDQTFQDYLKKEKAKIEDSNNKTEAKEKKDFIWGNFSKLEIPKGAKIADVSPDGKSLLITHKERDNFCYTQGDLWTLDLSTLSKEDLVNSKLVEKFRCITKSIDHTLFGATWTEKGIFTGYYDGTVCKLAKISDKYLAEEIDLG